MNRNIPMSGLPPTATGSPIADRRSVSLKDLYDVPAEEGRALIWMRKAFERGLQLRNPGWTIASLEPTISDVYGVRFREKYRAQLFSENAAFWIRMIDHAFIMGQLTAHFGERLGATAPDPRHLVEAGEIFKRATSSRECVHWIDHLKAYELPLEAPETPAEDDQPCELCP